MKVSELKEPNRIDFISGAMAHIGEWLTKQNHSQSYTASRDDGFAISFNLVRGDLFSLSTSWPRSATGYIHHSKAAPSVNVTLGGDKQKVARRIQRRFIEPVYPLWLEQVKIANGYTDTAHESISLALEMSEVLEERVLGVDLHSNLISPRLHPRTTGARAQIDVYDTGGVRVDMIITDGDVARSFAEWFSTIEKGG